MQKTTWIYRTILRLAFAGLLLSSCEKPLDITKYDRARVDKADKLSADGGEEVVVYGKAISWAITASIKGQAINFTPIDASTGKIVLPAELALGLTRVDFVSKNKKIGTLPIVNSRSLDLPPIITESLDSICDDFIYKDKTGAVTRGSRSCVNPPPQCDESLTAACIANAEFPAVEAASILPENIRAGTQIAGTTGTLAAPSACVSDGEVGCVSTDAFKAAAVNGAAAKILLGETIAGVAGSAPVSPSLCAADGEGSCVVDGTVYKAAKLSNIVASDLKLNKSLAGITGTLPSCNSDNGVGCVTSSAYPSVILANINPGIIKASSIVAGITGSYPNSTYPLAVGDGYADLDVATFDAKIKSSTHFGWFDRNGTRYSAPGDVDITAAKLKSGVSMFGETGNYAPACATDGESSCAVDGTLFKAAALSNFNSWDLRRGKTVAGVSGEFTLYNNGANLGGFNRAAGSGSNASGTVPDSYDNIDDFGFAYGNGPSAQMFGSEIYAGPNWLRDSLSDSNTNSVCDGLEACVLEDRITGKKWAKDDGVTRDFEAAITYCHTLNYGGYASGWRLPTEKELAQAYIDGIWQMRYHLNIVNSNATTAQYWTATSPTSEGTFNTNGQTQSLYGIVASHPLKSASFYVICLR